MAKRYKKNNKSKDTRRRKGAERDITKISVPSANANRDMIACAALRRMVGEIQDAKNIGRQDASLYGHGNKGLPPREAIEKIHEAGYDLSFSYWKSESQWSIYADWQPGYNGAILMREGVGFHSYDRETTLDEIYKDEGVCETKSQHSDYDINSIKVPLASDDRDVIACESLKKMVDKIKEAKKHGDHTAYICSSEKLPPKEAVKRIHEAGYDLEVWHYDHDNTWWITASWRIGCSGVIKMKMGALREEKLVEVMLDEIYAKDLVYRGKMQHPAVEEDDKLPLPVEAIEPSSVSEA